MMNQLLKYFYCCSFRVDNMRFVLKVNTLTKLFQTLILLNRSSLLKLLLDDFSWAF